MRISGRKRNTILFILLGACMLGATVALNVGWIILNWRRLAPMLIGIPFFALLIAGVVLNTIFLVREVRRNERHDAFLNAVTHELKTPIASIRLYLETLLRRDMAEEKRREFYSMMLEDSDWLQATVEQVLKAGELGQRTQNQVRVPVDMRVLVAECKERTRARHHLDEGAIVFEDSSDSEPVMVRGNREELQSVVMNLLDNAVKYSQKTVEIKMKLSIRNEAWIVLSVADRGIGIPAGQLKRVFKRFYRVPMRPVLRTKGTGLGLFIVRTIARQHGGDAFAESAGEGGGTTVRVELPRLLRQGSQERELSTQ